MPIPWNEVNNKTKARQLSYQKWDCSFKAAEGRLALQVLDIEVDRIQILEASTERYSEQ